MSLHPLLDRTGPSTVVVALGRAGRVDGALQQIDRNDDMTRPEPLAERLGLLVITARFRGATVEKTADHEVDRFQVAQLVTIDRKLCCLGQEAAEHLSGDGCTQPFPGGFAANPEPDVGIAPLVPRSCICDETERCFD